jgi:uncharacterized protein (UPF0276 family)
VLHEVATGGVTPQIGGIGLGLRGPLAEDILGAPPKELEWLEIAPENYLRRGGRYPANLRRALALFPLVSHGISLSLGGVDPFDRDHLRSFGAFLRDLEVPWHSDHLSFGTVGGTALHELLPVPFSRAAARHVAARIREARDLLGVPFAVENITFYARPPGDEMTETEFIREVVTDADCGLLLDVNNVYVNARNHGGDATVSLTSMPLERVVQLHVAGHDASDPDLSIDTHGEAVCEDVFLLLEKTLELTGPLPILLERDDNFPPWEDLCGEIRRLHEIRERVATLAQSGATSC